MKVRDINKDTNETGDRQNGTCPYGGKVANWIKEKEM